MKTARLSTTRRQMGLWYLNDRHIGEVVLGGSGDDESRIQFPADRLVPGFNSLTLHLVCSSAESGPTSGPSGVSLTSLTIDARGDS